MARVLFLSFFYPPVGGSGLPGSQRAVKFINNFKSLEMHVATVHPDCYTSETELNFPLPTPLNAETIHYTKLHDYFGVLLKCRAFLRRVFRKSSPNGEVAESRSEAPSGAAAVVRKSLPNKLKDFVYDLCYFPDLASGWIFPAVIVGRRVVKREKIEVIFTTGMPWSALVAAWLLHKLTGVPFVVDFRDPWLGNPFHQSKGALLDALGRWLERTVVTDAALVCANTDPLRDEFCCRYPTAPPAKFVVIPNGFDPADFAGLSDPADKIVAAGALELVHAGFLYGKRDPVALFEAFGILRQTGEPVEGRFKFTQIGKVELDYDFSARFAGELASGAAEVVPVMPYRECLVRQALADVLLLIQPGTKTQVPSKLYDYLCLGRPILTVAPLDGALGKMILTYGFGDVFDPADTAGLAARLRELAEEKRQKGVLVADYPLKSHFNVQQIAARLEAHLLKVAAGGG